MAKKESLFVLDEKGVLTIAEGVTEIRLDDIAPFVATDIKKVVIPKGVTKIGHGAFAYCKNLKNITLPSSVEEIEVRAFLGSGIEKISIPEGVVAIGHNTFRNCEKLEIVNLPKSIRYIGVGAFGGCKSLKSIKITAKKDAKITGAISEIRDKLSNKHYNSVCTNWNSVIFVIDNGAFEGSGLEEIAIDSEVRVFLAEGSIPYGQPSDFKGTQLRKAVMKCDDIHNVKFRDCKFLEEVDLGGKALKAQEVLEIFKECDLYKILYGGVVKLDTQDIEERFETDGKIVYDRKEKKAVWCDNSLKEIKLKEGYAIGFEIKGFNNLEKLELDEALCGTDGRIKIDGCEKIESVKTSVSMKYLEIKNCGGLKIVDIGAYASVSMEGCPAIEKLRVPSSVIKSMEYSIWEDLGEDTDIEIYNDGSENDGVYEFDGTMLIKGKETILYCKKRVKELVIPEGVTRMMNTSMVFGDEIERIVVPKSFLYFPYEGMKGLKEVVMPNYDGAERTPESLRLNGCTALKEVTLPSCVEYFYASGTDMEIKVEGERFEFDGTILIDKKRNEVVYCRTSAENVVVPEGITRIAGGAFGDCKKLKKIVLPKSVYSEYSIAKDSFVNCDADIEISGGGYLVEEDGMVYEKKEGKLLYVKNNVRDLVIPKEVKDIEYLSKNSMSELKTITVKGTGAIVYPTYCEWERIDAVYMKPSAIVKMKKQIIGVGFGGDVGEHFEEKNSGRREGLYLKLRVGK